MADRWAVANGNWSNAATWNGGTLPTSADDVYANNFTVTIDQNITALSLRTTAGTGINAGGRFDLNSGFNVTANIRAGGTGTSQACLYVTFNSPTSTTINGNVFGSSATSSNIYGIWHIGSGTITINGSVTAGSGTSGSSRFGVYNQSIGSIVVNGDVNGNTTGNGANSFEGIRNDSTGSITVNGNVYGSTTSDNRAIRFLGGGTYTQTGNIIGTLATANAVAEVVSCNNTTVNIVGNIESGLQGNGIVLNGNCVFTITGTITSKTSGNNFNSAVSVVGTSSGTIYGNVFSSTTSIGSNNVAVYHNGTGTVTINGDIIRQGAGGTPAWLGQNNATLIVNGNLYGSAGSSSGPCVRLSGNNNFLTINGNLTGLPSSGNCLPPSGTHTIVINGNITQGTGVASAIRNTSGSLTGLSITVNGTVTGGTLVPAIENWSGTVTVRRVVGNGYGVGSVGVTQAFAIFTQPPAVLVVQEMEFGSLGAAPVSQYCRLQLTANSVVVFRDTSGNPVTLVNPSSVVTPPAVTDVRSGVSYNAGNLTGTCAVPAASSVAAGVAVDNTVGTAVLTQANVWNYALSSASSVAGSVGEKLKKTAIPADIIALG